jgi:hypothetical protein
MADLEFNRQDIESLAQKVSSLFPTLTETERDLLQAIFANAASNASPPSPNQPATLPAASDSAPQLPPGAGDDAAIANYKQQLITAYTPGNSFDSITEGAKTPRV